MSCPILSYHLSYPVILPHPILSSCPILSCPLPQAEHALKFPMSCPECLARFLALPEMTVHRLQHVVITFPCEDCNLVFYTEAHLGDHMAQFHVVLNTSSG